MFLFLYMVISNIDKGFIHINRIRITHKLLFSTWKLFCQFRVIEFLENTLVFEFLLDIFAYKICQSKSILKLNDFTLIIIVAIGFSLMSYLEVSVYSLARFIVFGLPSLMLLLSAIALEETYFINNNSLPK